MKYSRQQAKAYARAHLKGIWAATLTPFTPSLALDEDGYRANIRHWTEDLKIDGLFVGGKQGECFSMSTEERKRCFEIAVEACGDKAGTILSCSDQRLDVVIDLARHAQSIGADYIVVHAPVLHFLSSQDDTVYEYYRLIAEAVDIGIAMWSHPDSGYLLSPELCDRIARIDNIVAIKYSAPRAMYRAVTEIAGERLIVSSSSEEEWLDNIVELGWQVYLCSSPPYLIQTQYDLRMRQYTDLALRGDIEQARRVRDSLQPVRDALRRTRPAEKPHTHQKYWQELLGQVGGRVRPPMLQLIETEKASTRAALEECGLRLRA